MHMVKGYCLYLICYIAGRVPKRDSAGFMQSLSFKHFDVTNCITLDVIQLPVAYCYGNSRLPLEMLM